jgi:hypothetical protein
MRASFSECRGNEYEDMKVSPVLDGQSQWIANAKGNK